MRALPRLWAGLGVGEQVCLWRQAGMVRREIAATMGVTVPRVRQIEHVFLSRLRFATGDTYRPWGKHTAISGEVKSGFIRADGGGQQALGRHL